MGYPNVQNNPAGAIPVWIAGSVPRGPGGVPLGYQQISPIAAATPLTVPVGATLAIISVSGGAVRYRDDGTPPTAEEGMPVDAGQTFSYSIALAAIQFIQESGAATLDVLYYGPAS